MNFEVIGHGGYGVFSFEGWGQSVGRGAITLQMYMNGRRACHSFALMILLPFVAS